MKASELRGEDRWQRWLCSVGPGPRTASGVAWRLTVIWPPMAVLRLWLPAAVTFFMCALAQVLQWEAYQSWAGFAPVAMLPVVPVLLAAIFTREQGLCSTESRRALTVLPVSTAQLGRGHWLFEVESPALYTYVPSLLVLAAMPLPMWFKGWFAASLLFFVLLVSSFGAVCQLPSALPIRFNRQGLTWWWWVVGLPFSLAPLIVPLALIMRGREASTTYGVALICSATVIGSYMLARKPKGFQYDFDVDDSPVMERRFASGHIEKLRIVTQAVTPQAMIALFVLIASTLSKNPDTSKYEFVTGLALLAIGFQLRPLARPIRVLPLSTRQIALAAALLAACAAVPIAIAISFTTRGAAPTLESLLFFCVVAPCFMGIAILGLRSSLSTGGFILALLVFTFGMGFLDDFLDDRLIWIAIAIVGLVALLLLSIAIELVFGTFIWDSRLYPRSNQTADSDIQLGVSDQQKLRLYLAACLIPTFFGLIALLSVYLN